MSRRDVRCGEDVASYALGALPGGEVRDFERHLDDCDDCPMYIDQLRTTIRLTGRLAEADVPPDGRDVLLAHFRAWHHTRS